MLSFILMKFLEVVRLEGHAFSPEDVALARDMYLLQVSLVIVLYGIDFLSMFLKNLVSLQWIVLINESICFSLVAALQWG